MKKLLILLCLFTLISCGEESISEKDKRLAKEKLEQEPDWLTDPSINYNNKSYWYVVAEKKNMGYRISSVVEQDHNHFSIAEAKEQLGGGVFILNFIKINKETYDEQQ